MTIFAFMLAGGDRESVAPRAAKTALEAADRLVLVDTGEHAQKAIETIRALPAAEGRCEVVKYQVPGKWDCATARNFCLATAAEMRADWYMQVDTDEWFDWHGVDVREFLSSVSANTIQLFDAEHRQSKARFIRVPAAGSFEHRCHEEYLGEGVTRAVLENAYYHEVERTPEEEAMRQMDIQNICARWILDEPELPRPQFYLALSLFFFEQYQKAVPYFLRYAELLKPMPEYEQEIGWAFFMAALCNAYSGDSEVAIDHALAGMRVCPNITEFPWLLADQELKRGNPQKALSWAEMAIALGATSSLYRPEIVRLGFQLPETRFEWPWLLRFQALQQLGDTPHALEAARMAQLAKEARVGILTKESKTAK
jgi:tetratricopeptide (TPR) repeat protein